MKIAELKNRLSYYVRRVEKSGESLLVCDRDRPIARIDRVATQARALGGDVEWLDELERRGVVRRATARLPRGWLARRPAVRADVVARLVEERREGR